MISFSITFASSRENFNRSVTSVWTIFETSGVDKVVWVILKNVSFQVKTDVDYYLGKVS